MAGFFDFIKHSSDKSTQKQIGDDSSMSAKGNQQYSGIGNPSPSSQKNPSLNQASPSSAVVVADDNKKVVEKPSVQTISSSQTLGSSQPVNNNQGQRDQNPSVKKEKTIQKEPLRKIATDKETPKREQLDLMTHLTQRSNRVFLSAQNKAKELNSQLVDSEHLLHGLISDGEVYKIFTEAKIQPQIIEQELNKIYKKGKTPFEKQPQLSPRIKRILNNSLISARKLGFEFISPEHILLALFEEGEGIGARVLVKLGLKSQDLNKKITGKKEGLSGDKDSQGKTKKSSLTQFTVDLTAKAAQGEIDPVVERSDVIERVIHILSRRTKNNPALVGEAGVGKTAVVEGLAQKIVDRKVPEPLLDKKILRLDLMSMLAGASHRGDFEERMKDLIKEVKDSQGKIILFIDEIHNIVGAGASGENSLDASNFLKPSLARGELQLIGATTLVEYRKYIERDPALERRFQQVLVPEPTVEQAMKMLKAIKDKYEAFHRVKIPETAIEAAVKLSKRYVGERFLPDKAVDLIDEAASAVRLPLISLPEEIRSLETRVAELTQEHQEAEKSGDRVKSKILRSKLDDIQAQLKEKKEEFNLKKGQTTSEVTEKMIKDIVSRWTGIPISKISESETERLSNLEEIMHKRLINQNVAVEVVSQAVRRGRAGLKSTKRPIGSFVFLGPTGVGKTELAKTLAEILFGQEEAMTRFDMTEYMEKHEVAKLLGAPPGYVGYEEGGNLTQAVRRKPYSVVLFDEIEKAHPDIFNILLQILDDGRLTDNKGHVISFKNTVVICTSNIGTKFIQDELLKGGKTEIEEPPVLSAYVFSPRGREILTIGSKYFERGTKQEANSLQSWKQGMLLDYFAGQQVEMGENDKPDNNKPEFPIQGFDTHAISSKGVEIITTGDILLYRTSTTAKSWKKYSLIEYFKDNIVINALPDAPDEQLPTVKLKTHAFSTDEYEIVTFKDRFWRRKEGSTDWETGSLKDYFSGTTIEEGSLPYNYWDIHTFSPQGKELIISGDKVWIREVKEKTWKSQLLKDCFGKDFPLENEIQEKRKIDEEVDQKKYSLIKEKVMDELSKFFRPELINRFDEIVIFEPLKYHHMIEIVKLQLKGVSKLLEDQDIGFSYTESAVKEIVRSGFDPVFGARPLRRAIQKLIENQLSSLIIEGKLKEGDLVLVDFDGDNFVFNVEKVELVSKEMGREAKVKNYLCQKCSNRFKTEVVNGASVICSKCASIEVQEVVEKKQPQDIERPLEKNQNSSEEPRDPLLKAKDDLKETLQNGKLGMKDKGVPNQSQVQGGA